MSEKVIDKSVCFFTYAAIDADFGCSVIETFVDTLSDVNTGFTI